MDLRHRYPPAHSARTRSWEQAERELQKVRERLKESDDPQADDAPIDPDPETVREAVIKFLENKRQEGMSKNWERRLSRDLDSLAKWCEARLIPLAKVRKLTLEEFRKTWKGAAITRSKQQERFKLFCKDCVGHGWMKQNYAADLSKIKVEDKPTLPLTRQQFDAVLAAADRCNPKSTDKEYRRLRAVEMLLLLSWSGLRITDAAMLERSKLSDAGGLHLYTQKTGTPVYVLLPPWVAERLRALPNDNPNYCFWSGNSKDETPGKNWWSTLKKVFRSAGLPDVRPHMLRDTFAVEMLLGGVPIDQVSIMLGHSSVKITERHYLPWVKSRQLQLDESVRKAWSTVPVDLMEQSAQASARVN